MTCWNDHMPHMTDEEVRQATYAYYRAAYAKAWDNAWQSPMNPLRDAHNEPPVSAEPRARVKTTSLEEAKQGDKTGAIDVEFVRVR